MASTRLLLCFIGLLTLTTSRAAEAQTRGFEPWSVRLDGYVHVRPETEPVIASWRVSLKGEPYHLYVTKLQVLTGDVAYYDIITALQPYDPALTIAGDDAQLDLFATAPPGQKISAMGFIQFAGGARYLMISKVEYIDSPASDAPASNQTPTP